MNIDWKRKLTSRKMWIAIAAFVSGLVIAFGGNESSAAEVTGIIMSGASAIAYIVGEGFIDASRGSDGK